MGERRDKFKNAIAQQPKKLGAPPMDK